MSLRVLLMLLFLFYTTWHCWMEWGCECKSDDEGHPTPVVSLDSLRQMPLVLSCVFTRRPPLGEPRCTPDMSECGGPLSLWQKAPGSVYLWTFVRTLPKHRDVLLLSRRIYLLQPFFPLTYVYYWHTLLYIVKNKQRPYVMSIVVINKSIALCLGEQWSLNLLLFTVWSLSVQWTASLFSTIVPHSLKHLSLKCFQRQINCHWECKPANGGNGTRLKDTWFYMKSKRSSWALARLTRNMALFENPQEKPEIPFLSVMVLPGILYKTFGRLKCPKFQRFPREHEIWQMSTSVKILSAPEQIAMYNPIVKSSTSQQPVLASTRSIDEWGGSWALV